jgi:epoxyqueuosine reductase
MIARYARGADYHDVHKPALAALEDEIKRIGGPGTKALWYQDTGAFLERELAAAAGLGWQGKHTLLIDPERGSWLLLALVAHSLEITPDAPASDHCGTCTACLDACPTGAFPSPWVLDARRCISYLTIEHEGSIDPALRKGVGTWLFGCDICQEVCPWNRKAPALAANPGALAELTLNKVLIWSDEKLAEFTRGTPLERAGPARLKRNAAIVCGNLKDDSLLPGLEPCGRHEDPVVREAVYWAFANWGSRAGRAALARAQKHETDEALREQLIGWLTQGPA